jgi:hypothetical protein
MLADRASEAEGGSGSPPPMEHSVALDHVMEPVAKECYIYTRSWADGQLASRSPRAMKHERTYAPAPYNSE